MVVNREIDQESSDWLLATTLILNDIYKPVSQVVASHFSVLLRESIPANCTALSVVMHFKMADSWLEFHNSNIYVMQSTIFIQNNRSH